MGVRLGRACRQTAGGDVRTNQSQPPHRKMGCVQGKSILTEEDINFIAKNTAMDKTQVENQYQIFRMYDSNKDGHIDFREFMIVLYIMSNGSPEENLKQIFRVFDINNDGTITLKELQKIVRDLFLVYAVNGDKAVINETNADKASQEVLVKTAFKEMDENHDGKISQLEFVEACMTQKKFSTMLTLKIIDVFLADEQHTIS